MNYPNEDEIKAATLDSGVLVEYLSLDKEKPDENKYLEHLEDSLLETEKYRILYISALVKVELVYITCRLNGWKKAKKTIEEFLSNFVILRAAELDEIAAQIKCRVPIALADCYTLAIGKFLSLPTYFISEKELIENIKDIVQEELSIDLRLIEKPV